jgi:fatty acid-binding protein DegV
MMEALEERVDRSRKVRFGVPYVCCPDVVPAVTAELKQRYGADTEILSAPATPVISTHTGPGAWGIAYLVEDELR